MADEALDLMAEIAVVVVEEMVPAQVSKAVDAAVARIPVGKDGRDGRDGAAGAPGQDGRDGRDGQDAYLPLARAHEPGGAYSPGQVVTRAGSTWQATTQTDAEPGPNGSWLLLAEKGDAGKDARDPVDVADVEVKDGDLFVLLSDGRLKALGNVTGPQGPRGEKGETGARGEKGDPGGDGTDGKDARAPVDVADASVNENGELVVRLSDGTAKTAGKVVGRDGIDGKDGAPGRDARAPIDIVGATITSAGKLLLNFSNGTSKTVGKVVGEPGVAGPPGPASTLLDAWKGPYSTNAIYAAGDVVQFGGSAYIALTTNPGTPPGNGWDLFVSRGDKGEGGKTGGSRGPIDVRDLAAEKFNSVAAGTLLAGQPVYVNSSAQVGPARGDASATAEVVGVATTNTTTGATCTWQSGGSAERMDWTSVTGSPYLTPGEVYFVSPTTAGALTATPPTTEGQFVVQVGRAITTRELLIDVAAPVAL